MLRRQESHMAWRFRILHAWRYSNGGKQNQKSQQTQTMPQNKEQQDWNARRSNRSQTAGTQRGQQSPIGMNESQLLIFVEFGGFVVLFFVFWNLTNVKWKSSLSLSLSTPESAVKWGEKRSTIPPSAMCLLNPSSRKLPQKPRTFLKSRRVKKS